MSLLVNTTGPLGHGNKADCHKPTKLKYFSEKKIERITCGKQFCTVLDGNRMMFNWGNGEYGAFGDGKNENYPLPSPNEYFTYLKDEENITIKKVKSCESYSIALLNDGKLYGWGSN